MIFTLHLLACAWMTGLIWLIQLVHYPMFEALSEANFQHWMNFHTRRIGPIVGPAMLVEVATGLALLCWPSQHTSPPFALVNISLIALTWVATALFSIPAHRSLALQGKDSQTIQKLVHHNWVRTFAWSIRLVMLGYFALKEMALFA